MSPKNSNIINMNPTHFNEGKLWQQVECIRDPLNKYIHFEDENEYRIEELLGRLPYFMNNLDNRSLKEQMIEEYFKNAGPCYEIEKASVDIDGVYRYPQDDDLYPIFLFLRDNERVFIYPYALIAIITLDDDNNIISQFYTRMD